MTKYAFVLWAGDKEGFLANLQELGVVDITSAQWEASTEQRELITLIDRYGAVIQKAKDLGKAKNFVVAESYPMGEQAFEAYNETTAEISKLDTELSALNKEFSETRLWGAFSRENVAELAEAGLQIRLFSAYTADYKRIAEEEIFSESIAETDGRTYFAVIGDWEIDAQEHKLPSRTEKEIKSQIAETKNTIKTQQQILTRVASSVEQLEKYRAGLLDKLAFSKAQTTAASTAEDSLTIVEGWCPTEFEMPEFREAITLKSTPQAEDDVPVELRNSKFTDAFRFVGDFYALPKYGTADLTAYFSIFYMLFFGFCMGDAGYGAILVAGYFILRGKKSMARVARLTLYCGLASVIFGLLAGSVFGIQLAEWAPLASIKPYFLTSNTLFYLALGLGVVQIIFGLILNIIGIIRHQGFAYALGRIGWLIVMVSTGVAFALGATSSIWYLCLLGVGVVGMLMLHNPKKNPLVNIGSGLWNTYNDLTGLLGDVLSYIRLFALCLSGGTLALVFNSLILGITESMPLVIGILIAVVLLFFLHAINIFMTVIGSFVHPMRLTFVEFYKNAGFEAANRAYEPFKKEIKD